jgi:aryl-alcohol dehydrogenase-like predicted oxidoreductase
MQAFADLVRMGKVLYVGVSEWNAEQIRQGQALASQMGFKLISNQPQYSMLWRVIEAEVIPTSVELGLGQIVWSPMAQGILTGKYLPGQPAPAGSRGADPATASIVERFMNDETLTAVQNLRSLADGLGISMAQFALAWVLQNSAVSAAIVGASNAEQISSNIAASGVEIPADVMKQVDQVLAGVYQTDPALTKSPETRPC